LRVVDGLQSVLDYVEAVQAVRRGCRGDSYGLGSTLRLLLGEASDFDGGAMEAVVM
jgi:hypothetical protein